MLDLYDKFDNLIDVGKKNKYPSAANIRVVWATRTAEDRDPEALEGHPDIVPLNWDGMMASSNGKGGTSLTADHWALHCCPIPRESWSSNGDRAYANALATITLEWPAVVKGKKPLTIDVVLPLRLLPGLPAKATFIHPGVPADKFDRQRSEPLSIEACPTAPHSNHASPLGLQI